MSVVTLHPKRLGGFLAIVGAAVLLASGCSDSAAEDNASTIVRSTTNIAGAGVVGNNRDTTGLCPSPAPVDPQGIVGRERAVGSAEGIVDVPADPQRVVVLDAAALDASCAVGIWERVVGAATLDPDFRGDGDQELYLGTGLARVPGVGPVGSPDIDAIAALNPDLIIGADTVGDSSSYAALSALAPTVLTSSDGNWKNTFLQSAAALGRGQSAFDALAAFSADAEQTGRDVDASQTQASVIRFLPDTIRADGTDSFAGEVLDEVGVRRPPNQRGGAVDISPDDLTAAEGDIVYVRFDGSAGEEHGTSIMKSGGWEDLGSSIDGRIFVVNDTVWSGSGVIAARAILADIRNSLNAYVS